jgi:hypothetical protein
MKKKSSFTDGSQPDLLKTQSNSKDFVQSDRIEWLKLLYAEWLAKRSSILNNNKEIYLINEPDELDTEVYW